jgi:hypothetical protein
VPSAATHKWTEGHDKLVIQLVGSILVARHVGGAAGSVYVIVNTSPASFPAKHKSVLAHATVSIASRSSTLRSVQCGVPRSIDALRTSPDWFTTAQKRSAHEAALE